MIRKFYDWTLAVAARPHATRALALVAFIESSIFPIPPDVMLVPMTLAARERAWRFAAVATVASVLGGFLGYGIGYFLYESVGLPLLEFYGTTETFSEFRSLYAAWGAWIVLGAGLTPFPYKVVTIASGVVALDPIVFGIASLAARGLRFFAVVALLWYFGPAVRGFIEQRFGLVTTAFFALLIAGFLLVAWLA